MVPRTKKGLISLSQAPAIVIVLLVIGIVLTVGQLIMADVEEQIESTLGCTDGGSDQMAGSSFNCTTSIAFNATKSAQEGTDAISQFQSIFGIVIAAAIVLGVVSIFR